MHIRENRRETSLQAGGVSRSIVCESNVNLSDFENSKFLDFQNRISAGALPQWDPRALRRVLLAASPWVECSPTRGSCEAARPI